MKAIVLEDAFPETRTTQRRGDGIEPPKHFVDMKLPGTSRFTGSNVETYQDDILSFVSANQAYSIALTWIEPSLISSPQDQADAILEAPSLDLAARLRHVLPALPPVDPGEEFVSPEVVERLLSCNALIAPQRLPSSTLGQARRRYDWFRSKLIATLLDEPIEDGVTHPAEHVIDHALRKNSSECRDWLSRALVEHYETRPTISAAIVRCVGRLEYDRVGDWGMHVADDALRHSDIEVREAAVRALEAWGGCEALGILRRHRDSVAWLNEYVGQVIVDLSGTTS